MSLGCVSECLCKITRPRQPMFFIGSEGSAEDLESIDNLNPFHLPQASETLSLLVRASALADRAVSYMEAYKDLIASKTVREKHVEHKDKLAQTKLRDREVKEALKEQRQQKKEEKDDERHAASEAARFDRAFHHNSKRFEKDERERLKKEDHDKTGFMCEHGVWRCRICQPVTKHK